MGRTGATALLGILVAVSSAGWAIHTSVQATEVPFPWVPAMTDLLVNVAAVVAAILVLVSRVRRVPDPRSSRGFR